MNNELYITECPRDGQQGLPYTIPPQKRAEYINALMPLGFDIIDFGSFVSPKAVPQMADSGRVLDLVNKTNSATKLLAIVGNGRGALEAAVHNKVDILGFPYSISNTFLERNINSTSAAVLHTVDEITDIAEQHNKQVRIYISMAFGNPYGDEWSPFVLQDAVYLLANKGIKTITLSDTTGLGTPESIYQLFSTMLPRFPKVELGIHLHSQPQDAAAKIEAAWKAGCRHFDGVINGLGGCPLTGYELTGNINTLEILRYCNKHNIATDIDANKVAVIAEQYGNFS